MKYLVTAVCYDTSVKPAVVIGDATEEVIDPETNIIFSQCYTVQDVEFQYETFWNYINDPDKLHRPDAKVKVLTVERM